MTPITGIGNMFCKCSNATAVAVLQDIGRCPYGPRSGEEVKQFTTEIAQKLVEFDIKMLVIICSVNVLMLLQ
jgi:glutamate racemase